MLRGYGLTAVPRRYLGIINWLDERSALQEEVFCFVTVLLLSRMALVHSLANLLLSVWRPSRQRTSNSSLGASTEPIPTSAIPHVAVMH
jgi:hypothetical protein